MYILGINGNCLAASQDPAATLIKDNKIIVAAEEERFNKHKHSPGELPIKAVKYCFQEANIKIQDVDILAYYTDTYLNIKERLTKIFDFHFGHCPPIVLVDHHKSHAASAYYTSGFDDAIVLTMDVSGDGVSTKIYEGDGTKLHCIKYFQKPNSLGIFYSLITQFLGFQFGDQEYVAMGLSSYGKPNIDMSRILTITEDGYSFNTKLYDNQLTPGLFYKTRQERQYTDEMINILGKPRLNNEPVTQHYMDLAKSAQVQLEEAALSLLRYAKKHINSDNLCLAGGVALNCVMNSRLANSGLIKNVYVPPSAGDSGTSMGAALKVAVDNGYKFKGFLSPYLGPGFTDVQIKADLDLLKIKYSKTKPANYIKDMLPKGKIIGLFQGRMEFGARALGNRSILADPRDPKMKDKLNAFIKYREEFRPFAPSALMRSKDYFKDLIPSPYMTFVFDVLKKTIPAVTHMDNTSRVQTVEDNQNKYYYNTLKAFESETGIPTFLNTSLNVKGQPIVCTPKDALMTFYGSGMDSIVIGNYLIEK